MARKVHNLIQTVSPHFVEALVRLLQVHESLDELTPARIMRETSNDDARVRLSQFLADLRAASPGLQPLALALALECALTTEHYFREAQQVDVVWTGPLVSPVTLRRSAAVLLEVIHSAKRDLIILSYVAFRIRDALQALEQRERAGVKMHLILESEVDSQGYVRRDGAAAFDSLAELPGVTVYTWPLVKRPARALLHAKAVVADGRDALVSSANLTENGISSNIEIGVRICGGPQPAQIHEHVMALIAAGEFVPTP